MFRLLFFTVLSFLLSACSTTPATHLPERDLGLLWVNHAAEYEAITRQTYQSATAALPEFIENTSWSAQPGQTNAEELPPAVVLDVDETVMNNAKFQIAFERPFANAKLEKWNDEHVTDPVPGVVEFITAAREAGVEVFFVTNRHCTPVDASVDPCPQKRAKIRDFGELGIETDAAHVLLSGENGWDRAKIGRRMHIAKTHRILMLIGDDLGDFVPCVRPKLYGPCTQPATAESRAQLVRDHREYWGHSWYMLPGPMHGSWTSHL
jgi:acid phosphatase